MTEDDKAFDLLVCRIMVEQNCYIDEFVVDMMKQVWFNNKETRLENKRLERNNKILYKSWLDKSNKLIDMEFKYE